MVLDQSNEILFEGIEVLSSEAEAIEQAEQIGVLAQEADAYQVINKGIAECSFGIFLYEGERLLASHPQVYASEEAAQKQINLLK